MSTFGNIIFVLLLVSVLGVLFVGIGSMLVGGDFNKKYGNKLMVARVALQGMALAMLLLLVTCGRG
jgi:hypothetical protein